MRTWSARSKTGLGLVLAAVAFGLGSRATPASAQNRDPAIGKALSFLRSRINGSQVGETGLIALALLKADVPAGDPDLSNCMAKLQARVGSGSYEPERRGGADIYEAAVVALAFSNLNAQGRRGELSAVAQFLSGRQNANGSWDYTHRTQGDTSISQYAVLGLWESENGGASVAPEVWDRAASWFMSVQSAAGSWNYHRDESGPETLSMTAAGVGSLLICQRQLNKFRRPPQASSPLLKPVGGENQRVRYDPANANAKLDAAIKRGLAWVASNFTTRNSAVIGQSAYYGLYGIERIGALADKETLGTVNWFDAGREFIVRTQRADGAWDASHGDVPNTAWGVLFLTKSTAKTIKRIQVKQLGAGTLLGGRGLPKDLTNLTVAGGRVVARPMNGAVEGMLSALEDPRGEDADKALAGLVVRYRSEGAKVLQPHKERFRKLITDRDPGLRKVAAWSLARTGDLDAVPALIDALGDADDSVVTLAREGLQLISRKADGFGPPGSSTPEQRREASKRWRAWYDSVRPLDLNGSDEDETASASPPTGGPR